MNDVSAVEPSPAPDAPYREEWRAFEQAPGQLVFLLGCQRSGTTWLHLQLASSGAFRYLSACDVQAGESLVHDHRRGQRARTREAFDACLRGAASDRGIDAIPATADTPEEYGLVIGAGGLRYEQPDTTAETLPALRELCAKKRLLEGGERPLLLKSPPDYPGAMPLLARTWSDARFVVLQRHPLRILQSQVRAWRALVLRRNPYLYLIDRGYRALCDDDGRRMRLGLFLHSQAGVDWLADTILRAQLAFLRLQDAWVGSNLFTLRYEDLCVDQAGEFARLSRFLEVDLTVPTAAPRTRETPLTEEVRQAFAARRSAFTPYLERFGYAGAAA